MDVIKIQNCLLVKSYYFGKYLTGIDYHQFKIFQIYLEWDTLVPSDPAGGAIVIALLVFFSYAIVLNTVVPISLYVRYVKEFFKEFLMNFDTKVLLV